MKKHEKEVIQAELDAEAKVLRDLERQYQAALKDVDDKLAQLLGRSDADMPNVIYQAEHQKALRSQIHGILEQLQANEFQTISDFLTSSYQQSFIGTMYSMHNQGIPMILPIDKNAMVKAVTTNSRLSEDLYSTLGVDIQKLNNSVRAEISRGISAGLSYNEITRNIANASKAPRSRAATIVRTESHRIREESRNDARDMAKKKGADVVKQWDATLDGDTRKSHRKLDGQIREVDEPFEVDGKKAMYPGDFGRPEEDINCRCISLTRARWELDEEELQTLKERAAFFDLDKTQDFAEYERKYLGGISSENLENFGKYGIIDIEIDEFVPCLKDAKTGEILDTVVSEVTDRQKLKAFTEKNGWYINWNTVPKDCTIRSLHIKGNDAVQGLLAFRNEPGNSAMYAYWVAAAPHNRGADKKYIGVGGHLFAAIAEASVKAGYDGFIYGMAVNQDVLKHYVRKLGATPIGGLRFMIEEDAAHKLLETYTFEKGD